MRRRAANIHTTASAAAVYRRQRGPESAAAARHCIARKTRRDQCAGGWMTMKRMDVVRCVTSASAGRRMAVR